MTEDLIQDPSAGFNNQDGVFIICHLHFKQHLIVSFLYTDTCINSHMHRVMVLYINGEAV